MGRRKKEIELPKINPCKWCGHEGLLYPGVTISFVYCSNEKCRGKSITIQDSKMSKFERDSLVIKDWNEKEGKEYGR